MPNTVDKQRVRRDKKREIGEPPQYPDAPFPSEDEFGEAKVSLRVFCEECLADEFPLEWSAAHLTAISKLERSILVGGQFALAMPRGSGKSTLLRAAMLWAILFGHRRYGVIVSAEVGHATEMLEAIKILLETSDGLYRYFPDICWPIQSLGGVTIRAMSQQFRGEPTHIGWQSGSLILPTVRGNPASGALITANGILGKIRGQFHTLRTGGTIRPDFVAVDDPQTDESAASPGQCTKRERVIQRSILNLGGPGVKIAGVSLVTVIAKGDLAYRLLDNEANPEWDGQTTPMLISMPKRMDLWEGEYDSMRRLGFRQGKGIELATEVYRRNFDEMNDGAEVSWEARKSADELTALQHAMNLYLKDKFGFFSEYQQDPQDEAEVVGITEKMVYDSIGAWGIGCAPSAVEHVTAFIDVQDRLLYWMVMGWTSGFSGYVMAYGAWPMQSDYYFTYENARVLFDKAYSGGPDSQLKAALGDCVKHLYTPWSIDGGAEMAPDAVMIDAGFKARIVREFIREAKLNVLKFSYGRGITAANNPINYNYKRKSGEIVGAEWRQSYTTDLPRQRHTLFDANHWKSFVAARVATQSGDPGCIEIHEAEPEFHRMLAEHLSSEQSVRTEGRGRKVDQWGLKPSRTNNHLFDCLVGNAVAASMLGVKLTEDLPAKHQKVRVFRPPGRD